MQGSARGRPLSTTKLLDVVADTQALDQRSVGLDVLLLDVGQETATLADQHEEAATGVEVLLVGLHGYDENLMMYEIKSGLTKDDYIVWASDDLYEGEPAQTWEEYVENGGGEDSVYDDMGTEALCL